ncbi:MAG: hypothetical protein IK052_05750 [Bacteroidales bacterium]|nr:hypothetical protein [Bacteroidales bacterium]
MKRIIASFAAAVAICIGCFAQTKITFDNPDIKFTFKRCVVSGKIAYVDFLILNETGAAVDGLFRRDNEEGYGYTDYFTAVYDDEGMVYRWDFGNVPRIAGAEIGGYSLGGSSLTNFKLPVGVPVRMRLTIIGLDEYATELTLVKVAFRNMKSVHPYGIAVMDAHHLPITRD